MKLTLITPQIGRKRPDEYVHTWQMEPLPMATLAGITPDWVDVVFYDERIEAIDFDDPTDLVGIAVETYTAKRAYEIAAEYRRRGVRTILGGYQVDQGGSLANWATPEMVGGFEKSSGGATSICHAEPRFRAGRVPTWQR